MSRLSTSLSRRTSSQISRDPSLRALVTQLAWLRGRILWRDGRVVFEYSNDDKITRTLCPEVSDLARAQHSLLRIERSKRVGNSLGGKTAWIAEQQIRLEAAKRLRLIDAPDAATLSRPSRERNPTTARRLAELLVAEALCVNELPIRPSELLLRQPELARPLVQEILDDVAAPQEVCALAAMVCGVLSRSENSQREIADDAWLSRAFEWGFKRGLPYNPSLVVALLRVDENFEYSNRCEHIAHSFHHLEFPAAALREVLADNVSAQQLVDIADAAARWENVAALWHAQFRTLLQLPCSAKRKRLPWRNAVVHSREDALQKLSILLSDLVTSTRDPKTILLTAEVASALVQLISHSEYDPDLNNVNDFQSQLVGFNNAAFQLLRGALDLRPELSLVYLQKLQSRLVVQTTDNVSQRRIEKLWENNFRYFHKLLESCDDAHLAAEAFDKDVHKTLFWHLNREPETLRWLISFLDSFETPPRSWQVSSLCTAFDEIPSLPQIRAVSHSILKHLGKAAPATQLALFIAVLDAARSHRGDVRANLSRLQFHLPTLLAFAQQNKDEDDVAWELESTAETSLELDDTLRRFFTTEHDEAEESGEELDATLLAFYSNSERDDEERVLEPTSAGDESASGETAKWLSWMLDCVAKNRNKKSFSSWQLPLTTHLATALSGGDFKRFQNVFQVAIRTSLDYQSEDLRKGIFESRHYPDLHDSLCQDFSQHPQRCITLLGRLGLTTRLGSDVCEPLHVLHTPIESDNDYSSWHDVLQLAPEMAATIAKYCAFRRESQQSDEIPRNIREVFAERQKRRKELIAIEERLKSQTQRPDLAARAASLRARLDDEESWCQNARKLLAERLHKATAEAHLLFAEQQLMECYRQRLRLIAGTTPDELEIDADLLNAILLSSDIESNRRLLRRLLRAHLENDVTWRERQPANAQFMRQLASRNIDTKMWLSEYSKRYRFTYAESEKAESKNLISTSVRLHLETQPIRILQMGNYFDTCLSFGGCNSFSTVTNASELNKRVIYATDKNGHVVGRKLIALNSDGKLVGFFTYTSLQNKAANTALQRTFRRYVSDFAAQCGLEMADEGEVPKLFAQNWYNDGIVPWDDESEPKTSPSNTEFKNDNRTEGNAESSTHSVVSNHQSLITEHCF